MKCDNCGIWNDGGKEMCDACGSSIIEMLKKADGADFRAFRREVFLVMLEDYSVSENGWPSDGEVKALWENATIIARAEPKGE